MLFVGLKKSLAVGAGSVAGNGSMLKNLLSFVSLNVSNDSVGYNVLDELGVAILNAGTDVAVVNVSSDIGSLNNDSDCVQWSKDRV